MKAICPICQKEIEWEGNRYRPFCSERCKLVDLGRWASEAYRVPAPPEQEEDEAADRDEEPSKENSKKGENGNPFSR